MRPKLVAEIAFAEWTQNGLLRQPRYEGLRTDKRLRDCRRKRPRNTEGDITEAEVTGELDPSAFTPEKVVNRLSRQKRDPMAGVLKAIGGPRRGKKAHAG